MFSIFTSGMLNLIKGVLFQGLSFLFLLALSLGAGATPEGKSLPLSHELPKQLEGVGITEKLGGKINLDLEFTHDKGHKIALREVFNKQKPVILTVVYYDCPSLCNLHLNGLTTALRRIKWKAGNQYELVAVSMDHKEGYKLASLKKKNYMKAMGLVKGSDGFDGWHFLTGTKENIKALTDQLGFYFKWNDRKKEFSHASAAVILTSDGEISRYIHGVEFVPQTIEFSFLEASKGKIGNIIDQIVLYCFQFDPTKNKYTIYAFNIMRIAAGLMILLMALFLIPNWLKARRNN